MGFVSLFEDAVEGLQAGIASLEEATIPPVRPRAPSPKRVRGRRASRRKQEPSDPLVKAETLIGEARRAFSDLKHILSQVEKLERLRQGKQLRKQQLDALVSENKELASHLEKLQREKGSLEAMVEFYKLMAAKAERSKAGRSKETRPDGHRREIRDSKYGRVRKLKSDPRKDHREDA